MWSGLTRESPCRVSVRSNGCCDLARASRRALGKYLPLTALGDGVFFLSLKLMLHTSRAEPSDPAMDIRSRACWEASFRQQMSPRRLHAPEERVDVPLALGVVGACAMCLRVLVPTAVLNLPVFDSPSPLSYRAISCCGIHSVVGIRRHKEDTASAEILPANPSNPLQFASALQAAMFQIVLFVVRWAQNTWAKTGVIASAGILGLTDIDALVVSMAKDSGAQLAAEIAARAIAIGVLTNTLLKLVIGVVLGLRRFRRIVSVSLFTVALACAISLAWLRRGDSSENSFF